jgi:GATA-binding protein
MQSNTFADDLDVASLQGTPHSHARAAQPATSSAHQLHLRQALPHHPPYSASSLSTFHSLTSANSLASFDGKLELSPSEGAVRSGVLQETYFPTWKDDAAGGLESPEEMQQKDPLATQVWKLYSKAKSQLPNAERMENLTWRMMSMNLRKLELERKGFVLDPTDVFLQMKPPCDAIVLTGSHSRANRQIQQPTSAARNSSTSTANLRFSAPSGIAQLRKASDQSSHTLGRGPGPTITTNNNNNDAMNLDDFIMPTSIGTPAGLSPSPSAEKMQSSGGSAIPIRKQGHLLEQDMHISRASAPSVQPKFPRENEFGYVRRHVRKTSIDERRVRSALVQPW